MQRVGEREAVAEGALGERAEREQRIGAGGEQHDGC